jgi:redox-sensitive bicupin YhaK (pirin superfamily)
MQIRRADERGHAEHGWLDSHHTFSFADYYDPAHMGFRTLRVINEDRVQPARGFGTHSHRDMEIVTYVLEGELAHKDSMGNEGIIRPGDVQRMSAGTGVTHSEFNASRDRLVHFLQIWILPAQRGQRPGYEQKAFPEAERRGRLCLIASPGGRDGSVTVRQDAEIHAALLGADQRATLELRAGRGAWIHVVRGAATVAGQSLGAGDAIAVEEPGAVELVGRDSAEILVFDLG